MSKSKRRDFLRNSALAGLLAPVAMYWRDVPEARAQDDRTNLVLVFLPNGKVAENPFLNPGATPSFADGFEPYNDYSDRVIAFGEYGFQAFINEEYRGDHGGHIAPGAVMFSGDIPHVVDGTARGARAPSIDQIIANDYLARGLITNPLRKSLNIKMTGGSFRLPTQFFATPAGYTPGQTYDRDIGGVTQFGQPQEGFDLLFGDIAGMSGGATIDELRAYGRSVLDVPSAELEAIRPQLPAEGVLILDEHLQSLRELELSFADTPLPEGAVIPEAPGTLDTAVENHEEVFDHWVRVIDAAFRLDRTRIATIQFGGVASRFQIPGLGLGFVGDGADSNSGSDHHSYTHWRPADVPRFMDWYAQRVSSLLGTLQGGPGRADMLERSAVMVGMEFGRNHNARDVPVTLFGECGGYYDSGKVVTYGNELEHFSNHTGTLLSLARAMGVTDLPKVGHDNMAYHSGVPDALRR